MQEPIALPLIRTEERQPKLHARLFVCVDQATQVEIPPEVHVHPVVTTAEDNTPDTGPNKKCRCFHLQGMWRRRREG